MHRPIQCSHRSGETWHALIRDFDEHANALEERGRIR
jgi:hypothetical protein